MKKSELKSIIRECIDEARMGGPRVKDVPIYDKARKKILGYVDRRATSIGASKEVGAKSCQYSKVDGTYCWVVIEGRDYLKIREKYKKNGTLSQSRLHNLMIIDKGHSNAGSLRKLSDAEKRLRIRRVENEEE